MFNVFKKKRSRYSNVPLNTENVPKFFYSGLALRLGRLNLKPFNENIRTVMIMMAGITVLGTAYFAYVYYNFHSLWYHKILSIFSTGLFVYLLLEYFYEYHDKKIRAELPNMGRLVAYYYSLYGKPDAALEDVEKRCPKVTKAFVKNIKDALSSEDIDIKVNELKEKLHYSWLRMLLQILYVAKKRGTAENENHEDIVSDVLKRLTNIMNFVNLEKDHNDAELIAYQYFTMFFPLIIIPLTKWFNVFMMKDMGSGDLYNTASANTVAATMMLISNIGALFIHWMRRLNN